MLGNVTEGRPLYVRFRSYTTVNVTNASHLSNLMSSSAPLCVESYRALFCNRNRNVSVIPSRATENYPSEKYAGGRFTGACIRTIVTC